MAEFDGSIIIDKINVSPKIKYYYSWIRTLQQTVLGNYKYGTDGYMPLETLLHKETIPFKSDIFALGVISL